VQVEKGWAADVLAAGFEGATVSDRRHAALHFLEHEEIDSGIVVSRGATLRFWHLIFQEYLAARAVAGLEDDDQRKLLLEANRIYRTEWREMVLLLAGVLCVRQGPAKVDGLCKAALDRVGPIAPLAAKAKSAGLLGSMVNDLKPLAYQPSDGRYRGLMDAVLGIFDRENAKSVEFSVRLEAAEALGQAGDPRLSRNNWVRIEAPDMPPFEIGKYPVTVAEYRQFLDDGGYGDERWWKVGGFSQWQQPDGWDDQFQHPNRPVTGVSWYEAAAYAAWAGVRLPTGAEWEFAARGPEGREYPWGNQPPDATLANYLEHGPSHPTPVGLYPAGATPEGILDLAGNVWEWLDEWYDKEKARRVLRGGAFFNKAWALRAVYRYRFLPVNRFDNFGFRCVREVPFPRIK
jgi:hypothetical protein